PSSLGQRVAIAELRHAALLGALLEPHEDVSALVRGLREEAALEESEIEDVQHATGEARYELAPQRCFGRGLRSKGRLFEQPGLDAVARDPVGPRATGGAAGARLPP